MRASDLVRPASLLHGALLLPVALLAAGCAQGEPPPPTSSPDAPVVTWTFGGSVFRMHAGDDAPEDVSARIPRAAPAPDRWLVPSPRGRFYALPADVGTGDGEVLVRLTLDTDADAAPAVEVVRPGGAPVYLEGMPAVTDDGRSVVYAASGGPHDLDLFRADRLDDGSWDAPVLLTATSAFSFHNQPSLAKQGDRVLCNCGSNRDPESGDNSACAVALFGGGEVDVLVAPDTLEDGRNTFVNFPRDAGGARVVFEASWPQDDGEPPETLWQRTRDGAPTPAVPRTFDNSVSPCVLADGSIVALWLGRPGGTGAHELTQIHDDGDFITWLPDVDVDDIGIGCTSLPQGEPLD